MNVREVPRTVPGTQKALHPCFTTITIFCIIIIILFLWIKNCPPLENIFERQTAPVKRGGKWSPGPYGVVSAHREPQEGQWATVGGPRGCQTLAPFSLCISVLGWSRPDWPLPSSALDKVFPKQLLHPGKVTRSFF